MYALHIIGMDAHYTARVYVHIMYVRCTLSCPVVAAHNAIRCTRTRALFVWKLRLAKLSLALCWPGMRQKIVAATPPPPPQQARWRVNTLLCVSVWCCMHAYTICIWYVVLYGLMCVGINMYHCSCSCGWSAKCWAAVAYLRTLRTAAVYNTNGNMVVHSVVVCACAYLHLHTDTLTHNLTTYTHLQIV